MKTDTASKDTNAASKDRVTLIRDALENALHPSHLTVEDLSAEHHGHAGAMGMGHFEVTVVSSAFTNKTPVQRHKMVYQALGDLMQTDIHAIIINAKTDI